MVEDRARWLVEERRSIAEVGQAYGHLFVNLNPTPPVPVRVLRQLRPMSDADVTMLCIMAQEGCSVQTFVDSLKEFGFDIQW